MRRRPDTVQVLILPDPVLEGGHVDAMQGIGSRARSKRGVHAAMLLAAAAPLPLIV
jgi:hypothetical protein